MTPPQEQDSRPWCPELWCCGAVRGQTSDRTPAARLCTASFSHTPTRNNTSLTHLKSFSVMPHCIFFYCASKKFITLKMQLLKQHPPLYQTWRRVQNKHFSPCHSGGMWSFSDKPPVKKQILNFCLMHLVLELSTPHIWIMLYTDKNTTW